MLQHIVMNHPVDIVVTENGVASTYRAEILSMTPSSQRTIQIKTPKKADGTMLDLVSLRGKPFMAVYEVEQGTQPLIVAYPAYYVSFSTVGGVHTYVIKLEGSPKVIKKRTSQRIDREVELLFKTEDTAAVPYNTGRSINISTGGIKFRTSVLLKTKHLILFLNLDNRVIKINGSLRGSDITNYETHTEYTYRIMFDDGFELEKAAIEKALGTGISSDADVESDTDN